LVYEDAPMPTLGPGKLLIKVRAAGITPTELTWGSTFTDSDRKSRLPSIPAFEVSGTVEKMAPGAAGFSQGDGVYALLNFWRDGAAAEYVTALAAEMAPKPKSLDFVQSAVVPLSGLTAWQALFDHAKLSGGGSVLVHGAAGGVGTYAVQLAKWKGLHVIATCSKQNADLASELGADEVIDYANTRFDDVVRDVDAVLDTVGGETLERSWKVLRRGGTLVTIVDDVQADKAAGLGVNGISMLVRPSQSELNELARLIDGGELRPIISGVFPLSRAKEAYQRALAGHNRGKFAMTVGA